MAFQDSTSCFLCLFHPPWFSKLPLQLQDTGACWMQEHGMRTSGCSEQTAIWALEMQLRQREVRGRRMSGAGSPAWSWADEGIVHLHLVCWQQRWGSSCGALALEFLVSLCCSPTDCFPVGKHLQEEVIHHLWKATDAEMWSIPSFPETGSAGPAGAVRDLTLDRTILFFFLALNNVNHLSFFLPLERVFSVT